MSPKTKPEQAKLSFILCQGYISLQKKCFVHNLSARSKAFFHDFQNPPKSATIKFAVHTNIHVTYVL